MTDIAWQLLKEYSRQYVDGGPGGGWTPIIGAPEGTGIYIIDPLTCFKRKAAQCADGLNYLAGTGNFAMNSLGDWELTFWASIARGTSQVSHFVRKDQEFFIWYHNTRSRWEAACYIDGDNSSRAQRSTGDPNASWQFVDVWFESATNTLYLSVNLDGPWTRAYPKAPDIVTNPLDFLNSSGATTNTNWRMQNASFRAGHYTPQQRADIYALGRGVDYPNIVKDGLVGYWRCDEATGPRIDVHGSYDMSPVGVVTRVDGHVNTPAALGDDVAAIDDIKTPDAYPDMLVHPSSPAVGVLAQDGGGYYLDVSNNASYQIVLPNNAIVQPIGHYMVFQTPHSPSVNFHLFWSSTGLHAYRGLPGLNAYAGTTLFAGGGDANDNVHMFKADGANSYVRLNGALQGSVGNAGTQSFGGTTAICSRLDGTTEPLSGKLRYYQFGPYSDDEYRDKVEAWLKARYGTP